MSYYNNILKCIEINKEDIEKYNKEYQDDYLTFFEGCKDFDKLKSAVGISCLGDDGDIIVLKAVREGNEMIRPRDIIFPKNTSYGEAGCFIVLGEIDKYVSPKRLKDKYIKDGIKEYLKYVSPKCNFIIMAY